MQVHWVLSIISNMKAIDLITAKSKVDFVYSDNTLDEVLTRFSKKRYSMVPVLERGSGRYIYSISSFDVLMHLLKNKDIEAAKKEPLSSVSIDRLIVACTKDGDIEEVVDLARNQNYVPIVDSKGQFLGIVTRASLLDYLAGLTLDNEGE